MSVLPGPVCGELLISPESAIRHTQVTGQLRTDGQFQARLQGVLTLHRAGRQIVMEVQGQLIGDSLAAMSHFSVPYVDWGMKDPSILFFTVAKQVEIDIVTVSTPVEC